MLLRIRHGAKNYVSVSAAVNIHNRCLLSVASLTVVCILERRNNDIGICIQVYEHCSVVHLSMAVWFSNIL